MEVSIDPHDQNQSFRKKNLFNFKLYSVNGKVERLSLVDTDHRKCDEDSTDSPAGVDCLPSSIGQDNRVAPRDVLFAPGVRTLEEKESSSVDPREYRQGENGASDPRSTTQDLRTKKSTAKRSRANVWTLKSDRTNLIERSGCEGLEWSIAKNQGKKRAIYPLSIFPWLTKSLLTMKVPAQWICLEFHTMIPYW